VSGVCVEACAGPVSSSSPSCSSASSSSPPSRLPPLDIPLNLTHYEDPIIQNIFIRQVHSMKNFLLSNCDTSIDGGSGSTYFDLSSLAGKDYPGSDSGYNYQVSICGSVSETVCNRKQGSVCQYSPTGSYLHMLSSWANPPAPQWSLLNPTDPTQGVNVLLANGDGCPEPRQVIFNFECDKTTPGGTYTISYSGCSYLIAFPTKYGCPTTPTPAPSKSKISGGAIFLILIFCSLFVYVVAGCVFKTFRRGTTGIESCPNVEFWRDLPLLVKEGCVATFTCCRSSSSSSSNYETVK